MQRTFVARPINAATGSYGNQINVNIGELVNLKQHLQKAFDQVEGLDDETFQAIGDGEQLSEDLNTYIRELATTIQMLKEM